MSEASAPSAAEPRSAGPAGLSPPRERRRGRGWLRLLLRLAIAAAILYLLFVEVPIEDVARSISLARPAPLVMALCLALMGQVVVAERLTRLLLPLLGKVRRSDVLEVNLTALFYALFLPAGNASSFVIRFVRLVPDRTRWMDVGGTLFIDRVVASVALAVVGLGAWLIDPLRRSPAFGILLLGSTLGFLGLVAVLQTGRRLPLPARKGRGLTVRWLSFPRSLRPDGRTWLVVIGLSLVTHTLGILAYAAVARSLGLDVSVVSLAWIRSGMMLAAMLPVSFAGLGLREGASVFLLEMFGVSPELAVAFSLLAFASTVLGVGLVGGLAEGARQLRGLRT